MRATSSGKGLFNAVLLKKLCESNRCVLRSMIAVGCQTFGVAAFCAAFSASALAAPFLVYSGLHDV